MANRARRRREAGFTMVELLIAIAMVAILAAIAVPTFMGSSRKAKARSEVTAIFNDMRIRIEQWAQENGTYPPTIGEGTMHPASAPSQTKVTMLPVPASWDTIRFMLAGPTEVYCRYTWVTGLGGQSGNIGAVANASFGFAAAPVQDWYYLLARCNLDDNAGTDSYYFSSSVDPTLQVVNEGS